jgi:hypothetical protein
MHITFETNNEDTATLAELAKLLIFIAEKRDSNKSSLNTVLNEVHNKTAETVKKISKEQDEESDGAREKLEELAHSLGIKFRSDIKTETLAARIQDVQESKEEEIHDNAPEDSVDKIVADKEEAQEDPEPEPKEVKTTNPFANKKSKEPVDDEPEEAVSTPESLFGARKP